MIGLQGLASVLLMLCSTVRLDYANERGVDFQYRAGSRHLLPADTLDLLPPWPTDEFQTSILGYLRYVSWFNLPYSMQKQLAGGVAVINPFTRRPYVSSTRNEQLYLLAWSTVNAKGYYYNNDGTLDSGTCTRRCALYAAHYEDTSGAGHWVLFPLMLCNPVDHWGEYTVEGHVLFAHRPTNADVYESLRSRFGVTEDTGRLRFFEPTLLIPGQRADLHSLLDAAVRVNTWRSVTGEAPTMFFPNGR